MRSSLSGTYVSDSPLDARDRLENLVPEPVHGISPSVSVVPVADLLVLGSELTFDMR